MDKQQPKSVLNYLSGALLLVLAAGMFIQGLETSAVLIDYSDFKQLVQDGRVEDVRIGATTITGHADRAAVLNTLPEATRAAVAKRSAQSAKQSLSFRAFRPASIPTTSQ